jgi:branched-chain amino acid transport system permease protein
MTYPIYRLFIFGFSFLVLLGMALLLMRTRIGIIIRAAVSDSGMVEALGNNVPIVFMGVFGGGSALSALAGVIAAPFLSTHLGMGAEVLLDCFVVIVVGGFGSLLGAFIASLMIGELQSFGILWIPRLALIFQFLLMTIVLITRPTGLLGKKNEPFPGPPTGMGRCSRHFVSASIFPSRDTNSFSDRDPHLCSLCNRV